MFNKKPFTYSPIDVKCKKETANKIVLIFGRHPPTQTKFSFTFLNFHRKLLRFWECRQKSQFKVCCERETEKIRGWVQRKRMWHLQLSATTHCRVAKENQRQKDEVASSYCSQLSAAPPSWGKEENCDGRRETNPCCLQRISHAVGGILINYLSPSISREYHWFV